MFVKKEFLIIGRCFRSFRNRKGQKKVVNQNLKTMFCLSAPILEKTRPDKTIFSALTNLTVDFDIELIKIKMLNSQCLLCLVL